MLDWWQINYTDLVQSGLSTDFGLDIPIDLRLSVAKGQALLKMTFPGVDEVLAICTTKHKRVK
jgi:hypothetical protein